MGTTTRAAGNGTSQLGNTGSVAAVQQGPLTASTELAASPSQVIAYIASLGGVSPSGATDFDGGNSFSTTVVTPDNDWDGGTSFS